jgi:hypothetical protein
VTPGQRSRTARHIADTKPAGIRRAAQCAPPDRVAERRQEAERRRTLLRRRIWRSVRAAAGRCRRDTRSRAVKVSAAAWIAPCPICFEDWSEVGHRAILVCGLPQPENRRPRFSRPCATFRRKIRPSGRGSARRGRTSTALSAMEGQRKARASLASERNEAAGTPSTAALKAERATVAPAGRDRGRAHPRYVAELVGADTGSERALN